MVEWWSNLTTLNQAFYAAAGFFSLIFLWQFISSLLGVAGHGGDMDMGHDFDVGDVGDIEALEAHSFGDAAESISTFHVLSVRAVLAFCTMFTWASALYLNVERGLELALVYATAWGLGAYVVVTILVNWMRRLAETGTSRLSTCVGTSGQVYLDIPAGGQGEARVTVSGVVSLVKARSADGKPIEGGTPITVTRLLDQTTVEVQSAGAQAPPTQQQGAKT